MASHSRTPAERVDRFDEAVEMISLLMAHERTTYAGRYYQLDDAPLEPRPIQSPRIPILIAAHRPRMLRLAAAFADQWDTFAAIPDTATDGIETGLAERIRYLDAACREIGRDPAEIRRSTWAKSASPRSGTRAPTSTSCTSTGPWASPISRPPHRQPPRCRSSATLPSA